MPAGNTQEKEVDKVRIVADYAGTVRSFRAWLRNQKGQVVYLAEYREKKKTARKRHTK